VAVGANCGGGAPTVAVGRQPVAVGRQPVAVGANLWRGRYLWRWGANLVGR